MWLVLNDWADVAAQWARTGLERRGVGPWQALGPAELAFGMRWEHRLENGRTLTNLTLPDGRLLRDGEVRGVLNRLTFIHAGSLVVVQPADRDYVAQELQAFLLSWLHSVPAPVLNRPTPAGLSGRLRHVSEWIWLAAQAGLPTSGYHQSSRDGPRPWDATLQCGESWAPVTSVVVCCGTVTGGAAPAQIQAGCVRLRERAGVALLGVDFTIGVDGRWSFAGPSTRPDLRIGGEPLLDALAIALNGREEMKR
ncbi:MAG TPA: hypothetical protein PK640_11320 [Verrucomicrobiota bacterium]|nr:hypothetical protein [Verrucomicrobiota bacterium]